ncbi:hypothetical protein CAPTEDRAFT_222250 [Capitella teleta]|uniref:BRCT domain-containing protein n=1 Tax=Capitella teleta TaxID=283909 RepID=R7UTQ4_CAPTE|nr:hypothetical protein CAPTEDRAFT_222250 [Capitella teleta]|eukprot:ELU07307.1 hypothetical protein CAPTEDRAFT_222250 [Capitella teleta]
MELIDSSSEDLSQNSGKNLKTDITQIIGMLESPNTPVASVKKTPRRRSMAAPKNACTPANINSTLDSPKTPAASMPSVMKTPGRRSTAAPKNACTPANINSTLDSPKTPAASMPSVMKTPRRRSMPAPKNARTPANCSLMSPCTPSVSIVETPGSIVTPVTPRSSILNGVVAHVEVRSKHENRSHAVEKELLRLGASIEPKLTKTVTHVVFKEGKQATWKKAQSWGVHLVSVLWIENCKENSTRVSEELFPARLEDECTPVGLRRQKRYKSMQPKDFAAELADSADRCKRHKQKQTKLEQAKASPFTPLMLKRPIHRRPQSNFFQYIDSDYSPNMTVPQTPPSIRIARHAQLVAAQTEEVAAKYAEPVFDPSQTTIELSIPLHRRLFSGSAISSPDTSSAQSTESTPQPVKSPCKLKRKASSPHITSEVTKDTMSDIPEEVITGKLLTVQNLAEVSKRKNRQGKRKLHSVSEAPAEILIEPECTGTQPKKGILDDLKKKSSATKKKDIEFCDCETSRSDLDTSAEVKSKIVSKKSRRQTLLAPTVASEHAPEIKIAKSVNRRKSMRIASQDHSDLSQTSGSTSQVEPIKSSRRVTEEFSDVLCKHRKSVKAQKNTLNSSSSSTSSREGGNKKKKKKNTWKEVYLEDDSSHPKPLRSLVTTSLHFDDQYMVRSVVSKLGTFRVEEDVSADTTHVICGSNRRTLNVLHGIAHGCWLVSLTWVMESLGANAWIDEEAYECVDFFPACRLSRSQENRDLFAACGNIFVASETVPQRHHIVQLLQRSGASLVEDVKLAKICVGQQRGCRKSVAEKWVLDSITSHHCLPSEPYKT